MADASRLMPVVLDVRNATVLFAGEPIEGVGK